MKTHCTIVLSIAAGVAVGAAAVQALHAQAEPPAYVVAEIDVANLMTLLKLKREGIEGDRMGGYFIDGGQELTLKELNRLASMDSFEATVGELTKLSF